MRRTGALGAVLLALALFAPGCDLVSSLTPFGIGTRDYSTEGANVNGNWVGKTASGGDVTFQVGNDTASRLRFIHVAPGCALPFEDLSTLVPIVSSRFTLEVDLTTGGRFVASGFFASATAASGTYFFEGLPAGVCPTAASGTFTANKSL
jgi:hypothetical protein